MTFAARVRRLFDAAHRAGASTDWYGAKGTADDAVLDATESPGAFLAVLDGAHDPRWEPLRCYLQGYLDGEARARFEKQVVW